MRTTSLLLCISLVAVFGCSDPCESTIKNEATSPDGKFIATAFIRDCGATTSFSPQVHLRPVGQSLNETGNVFIGNHSDEIQLRWTSSSNLIIYSDCEIITQTTNYSGVKIDFQPLRQFSPKRRTLALSQQGTTIRNANISSGETDLWRAWEATG